MNNKITYTKIGDYYTPNLTLEESKFKNYHLGKYGRMRLNYLKNHKKAEYIILFMNNKLDEHLYNTDIECKNQFDILMKQLAERENITEELKANNQMEWVRKMNNIKATYIHSFTVRTEVVSMVESALLAIIYLLFYGLIGVTIINETIVKVV